MKTAAKRAKIPAASQTTQPTSKGQPTEEEIRLRAYEIYLSRNGVTGDEVADWLQAEREMNLDKERL